MNHSKSGLNQGLAPVLLAMLTALAWSAAGEDHPHGSPADQVADTSQHSAEIDHSSAHKGHASHKNEIGVFLGLTHAGRRDNDPAIGLEYARTINDSFRIAGLVEATTGDDKYWIAAIPFAYVKGNWLMSVAPGIEGSHHGKHALLRLAGGYQFRLGGAWNIMPQVNLDLVDSHAVWVFGAVLGYGF